MSASAQAQMVNCSNVHIPECSKSPFAPSGVSTDWSSPTLGGGTARSRAQDPRYSYYDPYQRYYQGRY